jgi:hypothetical protein
MTVRSTLGGSVAVAVAATLAGCATGPTLEQRMLPLVGQSEANLVTALGVPVRTYEADGRKFLTFEERRSYIVAGDPFLYRGYSRYGPYFSPPGYIIRLCEITFVLRNERAESFTARGDGCR